FTLEYEDLLFRASERGLEVLTARHGPGSELAGDIADLAAALHARLPQPDSALSADVRARVPGTEKPDMAGVLHALIRALSTRRRVCAGPGCGASAHASADPNAAFRACGGCVLVRYCSPECQRNDWKRGHKKACTQFREILAVANPATMDLEQFRRVVAPITQRPEVEYELSLFAAAQGGVLSMDMTLRVNEIHRDAAILTGRPNLLAEASDGMDFVASILRRQEHWASTA
ncbi:hypothetical protein AURDEDRAFT_178404, partial [Auricularia subglabra TFB-10046 SS5]